MVIWILQKKIVLYGITDLLSAYVVSSVLQSQIISLYVDIPVHKLKTTELRKQIHGLES
jgi:hypothetical protein